MLNVRLSRHTSHYQLISRCARYLGRGKLTVHIIQNTSQYVTRTIKLAMVLPTPLSLHFTLCRLKIHSTVISFNVEVVESGYHNVTVASYRNVTITAYRVSCCLHITKVNT